MGKRLCVECRFCELCVDFDAGSHYRCEATGEPLAPGSVIHRPACGNYEPPPAPAHWGP